MAQNYQPRTLQAPSVAIPPRLPLVTLLQNRDATFDRDSRLVNAFAEKDLATEEYTVRKRPGLLTDTSLSGNGYGIHNWHGVIYSIFGATLYKNGVAFGTVDTTGGVYIFEQVLGSGWLVMNNGVKAYYTDGTTLTEIATFLPVLAGAFLVGSIYQIVASGNTDFVALGAANNNVGTVFTATNIGDPLSTGTAAIAAGSFQPGGTQFDIDRDDRRGRIRVPSTRPATSTTGSLFEGATYQINTLGTTDFTLIGASSNTVGVVFVSTGAGTGTGTVLQTNFPAAHVKGWAYLDGTLYVMDEDSNIYGTSTLSFGGIGGLDDPRLWDPLSVIVARTGHGNGISIAMHLSYLVAFKEDSTEFFYDAANPIASPLASVQGAHSAYGCLSADSIQDIHGTLIWISSSRVGVPQIVRLESLNTQVISTPSIDRLLQSADFSTVFSWNFEHAGHRFYGVTIKNSNLTLVYDLSQNLWYQWTDASGNYWPIVAHAGRTGPLASYTQHESNGKIYLSAADYIYPNDDGVLFPVDIYTPNFDGDVDRRKTLNAMFFNADQQTGSKLQVRFSDDDYQTWTNFREVNLGNRKPVMTNCGTFIHRAWHFRHYHNTPLRISAVGLQLDLGTL